MMQNPMSYIFGAGTDTPTYESLKKRREIADLLAKRAVGGTPRNVGEGIASIGNALASRYIDKKLGPKEDAERQRIADLLSGGMGGAAAGGGFTGAGMSGGYGGDPSGMPQQAEAPAQMPDGGYQQMAFATAQKHGIDPDLFMKQIGAESNWNPEAVSSAGAIGLGQLMPGTAQELGVDPRDPAQNLDGAARYFKQQLDTFGDPKLALAAYNAGPGNVQKHGGVPPFEETQNYVAKILGGSGGGGGDIFGGGQPDMSRVTQLAELLGNDYADAGQKAVAQALIERELSRGGDAITPYQAAQLGMDQQQFQFEQEKWKAEQSRGPEPQRPMTVNPGDVVFDPNTGQPVYTAPKEEAPGWRSATPEELQTYGAVAGQVGPDGKFQPINPPSGMTVETGPDGEVRVVSGPGAAANRPLNEGQSKNVIFATRARGSLKALEQNAQALTGLGGNIAQSVPGGRYLQSPEFQMARQAGDEFLQAILRKDTGAAITPQEQELYGTTYLPMPGDSPEVMAQKQASRARAIEALERGMTPAEMLALERPMEQQGPQQAPAGAPQPGQTEDGYIFKGGDPADPANWVKSGG